MDEYVTPMSLESQNNYGDESRDQLMVNLTTLYCQTQESVHIFSIIKHLRKAYEEHLKSVKKETFLQYESLVDKEVTISAMHTFLVIPFFDGFLLRVLDKEFSARIGNIVQNYNSSIKEKTWVQFVKKPMEPDYFHLGDKEKNQKFKLVNQ